MIRREERFEVDGLRIIIQGMGANKSAASRDFNRKLGVLRQAVENTEDDRNRLRVKRAIALRNQRRVVAAARR